MGVSKGIGAKKRKENVLLGPFSHVKNENFKLEMGP